MKAILPLLLLLFSVSLWGAPPINKSFFRGVAIEGYDCVAYFHQEKALKGKSEFKVEAHGAVWHFSSEGNRDRFQADPGRYTPSYGGHCAWAMSSGKKAGIDPHSFKIVDDRLFLNYNAKIHEKWEADLKGLIAKADEHWKKLIEE